MIKQAFHNFALVLIVIVASMDQIGYLQCIFCDINPLPDEKSLDWSKFKAFADNKINVN